MRKGLRISKSEILQETPIVEGINLCGQVPPVVMIPFFAGQSKITSLSIRPKERIKRLSSVYVSHCRVMREKKKLKTIKFVFPK